MKIRRHGLLFFTLAIAFVLGVSGAVEAQDRSATSHFAKLDNARIHYVNYGKGDVALVLIHGWTQNVDAWRDQIPDFVKHYRVVAIDLPGHGQSDKPEVTYSMELFARAVEAVMRDAKVKSAVLVGEPHDESLPCVAVGSRTNAPVPIRPMPVLFLIRPLLTNAFCRGVTCARAGVATKTTSSSIVMNAFITRPPLSSISPCEIVRFARAISVLLVGFLKGDSRSSTTWIAPSRLPHADTRVSIAVVAARTEEQRNDLTNPVQYRR